MPNNYFPSTGIGTQHAGKQTLNPGLTDYTLGVANILPNNQPYYVPGSGSSTTYAPGVIPDLSTPPPINPNVYKMGQQHLDAWRNAQPSGSSVPNNAPNGVAVNPFSSISPGTRSGYDWTQIDEGGGTPQYGWRPSGSGTESVTPFDNPNQQNPQNQGSIPAAGTQPGNFDLNAFLASIQSPTQGSNSTVANNLFGVLNGSPSSGTGRYSSATNWLTGPQQQT